MWSCGGLTADTLIGSVSLDLPAAGESPQGGRIEEPLGCASDVAISYAYAFMAEGETACSADISSEQMERRAKVDATLEIEVRPQAATPISWNPLPALG